MPIDSPHLFDNEWFAQCIRSARQGYQLSTAQLSQLTKLIDPAGEGISRVALSRYENGSSLPGLRELRLLALSLRLPLSRMVYGGEMSDPMTSYRMEVEMRISECVNNMITAEGVLKDTQVNEPKSPEFLDLLKLVKQQ